MKDLISVICLNFMHRVVREHCAIRIKHGFVYGGHSWGRVIQNSFMFLGGQEENVSNKENRAVTL